MVCYEILDQFNKICKFSFSIDSQCIQDITCKTTGLFPVLLNGRVYFKELGLILGLSVPELGAHKAKSGVDEPFEGRNEQGGSGKSNFADECNIYVCTP